MVQFVYDLLMNVSFFIYSVFVKFLSDVIKVSKLKKRSLLSLLIILQIGITVLVQITHFIKLVMMLLLTGCYVLINYPAMPELYNRYDEYLKKQYK